MRRHVLSRLIWIQTVCKGFQNSVPALKGLRLFAHANRIWYEQSVLTKLLLYCPGCDLSSFKQISSLAISN
ncbi:hypothetical protein DPMN_036860 [Dreissena polymorpha]|uniref:Uncharacterized protein n=1 Tax=Dreissena polymorpha TaxID=45954 RepID=A0A9D4M9V8_DREPO|nr:hypothetical protein DPMN_036860 [Dreissena polymorpha]